MPSRQFAKFTNARSVRTKLTGVVDQNALDAIEAEITAQCESLFQLALNHYRMASECANHQWRHRISRRYYASYSCSKSVRYMSDGTISTEVKDHARIARLPADFGQRSRFETDLDVLREDRNMCDYDHLARVPDLNFTVVEVDHLVGDFLREGQIWLKSRGLSARGNI